MLHKAQAKSTSGVPLLVNDSWRQLWSDGMVPPAPTCFFLSVCNNDVPTSQMTSRRLLGFTKYLYCMRRARLGQGNSQALELRMAQGEMMGLSRAHSYKETLLEPCLYANIVTLLGSSMSKTNKQITYFSKNIALISSAIHLLFVCLCSGLQLSPYLQHRYLPLLIIKKYLLKCRSPMFLNSSC